MFEKKSAHYAASVVAFLREHFTKRAAGFPSHERLLESIRYSLLQEGGKRFRPVLAMLTADALGAPPERALAFGAALECIHTYSLIHDDLPAMDDDDFRRGQPTNHKVYGEAVAILAGDSLLTEAFQIIADSYAREPKIAIALVAEAARSAGAHGMVGGQAIDLNAKKDQINIDELRAMHELKTGALIRASVVGAAIACRSDTSRREALTTFAETLGLAFQVADDLLDFDPAKPEPGSYPALMGFSETKKFLSELTDRCLTSLASWPSSADPLRAIARYNLERQK